MYVPHGSLYNVEAMLVPAPNHYKSDEAKMKLLKRQPSFSIPQQKRNVTRVRGDRCCVAGVHWQATARVALLAVTMTPGCAPHGCVSASSAAA